MAGMGTLIGAGIQAGGQIGQGFAAKKAGAFEAKQHMARATEEMAQGTRDAYEKDQETKRLISKQVAIGADSGAGGVGLLDIIADTQERGDYLRDTAIATAENKAKGRKDMAEAAKAKGHNALIGSFLEGASTIAKGYSKGKYG